jgi:hypothetical protein
METFKLNNFHRGWFIGDFEPSCFKQGDFEVGILTHKKGEKWPTHFHKLATEINLILKGKMIIQGRKLKKDDIFILRPNEIADPIFLTDCNILVIKSPSIVGDKYII